MATPGLKALHDSEKDENGNLVVTPETQKLLLEDFATADAITRRVFQEAVAQIMLAHCGADNCYSKK